MSAEAVITFVDDSESTFSRVIGIEFYKDKVGIITIQPDLKDDLYQCPGSPVCEYLYPVESIASVRHNLHGQWNQWEVA